jgi:hypothetical protein
MSPICDYPVFRGQFSPEEARCVEGDKAAPATRQWRLSLCRRVFALLAAASWKRVRRVNEC